MIEQAKFVNDGFLKIENAFSAELARACRDILWEAVRCDPADPGTWARPVVRVGELAHEPFRQAANTPVLYRAFDRLLGPGNWLPRQTLGSFPVRFPCPEPANDTGWHVDASFPGDADAAADYLSWRINVRSRGRALLMLFLFSDVGECDAPTRLRVGSHLDVAKILAPEGENGLSFLQLAQRLDTLPAREELLATGEAGTVYLCHPFVVHAAQDHRGQSPKFMAQPPLLPKGDFDLGKPEELLCPVEKAIVKALANR